MSQEYLVPKDALETIILLEFVLQKDVIFFCVCWESNQGILDIIYYS